MEVLEPRWGAIAIDYKNGAFGAVSNKRSKEAARKQAISSCIRNGGAQDACVKDSVVYSNKCGVVVESADFTVFFTGEEQTRTKLDALWACDHHSQMQCEILYAECSYEAKVRVR